MGLQVTAKGQILIDGKAPKGLRNRLWAWLQIREVNKQIALAKADAGLTLEEKQTKNNAALKRSLKRRVWLNAFSSFNAAVMAVMFGYSAVSKWSFAFAAVATVSAFLGVRDFRTFRRLRREQMLAVVDEVHDR